MIKKVLFCLCSFLSLAFSCESAKSCFDLAQKAYDLAKFDEASSLYKKACDFSHAKACYTLGILNYKKNDYQRAANLWQKACDMKEVFACTNLAHLYSEAKGVKKDLNKESLK